MTVYRTSAKPPVAAQPRDWGGVIQAAKVGVAACVIVPSLAWWCFVVHPEIAAANEARWAAEEDRLRDATHVARLRCVEGGGSIRDVYDRGGTIVTWSCEGGAP